ncbi:L,D-transpeptidase family protein [Methylocapsa aurea]|uniref:L,D-transpeptidase family protein n=1 Tax=Methylocapsa aurea TaxID=663610 RepID=UPI00138E3D20|nr:L,D-transpeptidase family protein [Methylocapsa aurea]
MRRPVRRAIVGLAALLATGMADPAGAMRRRDPEPVQIVESRPAGEPLMAIVSLNNQRITIYDADGWILRAPVSSGQAGYETPAGVYSILQKEADHHSNLYDDASMPFMQRITWSGIALHAGLLPGYPASHGCVRMPYEFAQTLFDMTKIGMRVIVARSDVRPVQIDHPVLFQPRPIRADVGLKSLTGRWDAVHPTAQAAPGAPPPEADAPAPVSPAAPLLTLKSIVAAMSAEAHAAAKKADAARLGAARITRDAARLLPAAEGARYRAEAQLSAAESAFQAASSPAAIAAAEEAKARALARRADAEAQLVAARAEAPLKANAAARAREEARVAEAEKIAALNAATEAEQMMSPASIFISRKTQRLYVRQAFQQVFEGPVTIREAGQPIGTHIYTALDYTNDGANVRWSAVSTNQSPDGRQRGPHNGSGRGKGRNAEPTSPGADLARAALDRVEIPNDIVDRISEIISPQSSLIISDEGMSAETGKDTDFVILLSGGPQGGVKMRRPDPQAHNRREDWHDRGYERSRAYAPSFYGGGAFDPW